VHASCRDCGRITRHEVLHNHDVESAANDDYPDKEEWQIVRCRGCHTCGFRYVYHDYVDIFETQDGEQTHRRDVNFFPSSIRNHKQLGRSWLLSDVVRKVYDQTLASYGAKSYLLASIGLRATIEAVCGDLGVVGPSLEKRIDKLFKEGYVSNEDKKRLHAIRFLGNDAAHEVVEPGEVDLRVALDIVENLLNSVFILTKRAESLGTIVENDEGFFHLIDSQLVLHKEAQTLSLKNLLGKRYRLVGVQLEALEQLLKTEIASGRFPRLFVGKEEEIEGYKVQLYSITAAPKSEIDKIPF
jgi:hypothetical protein